MVGLSGCLGGGSTNTTEWLVDPFHLPGEPENYPLISFSPSAFDEYSSEFERDEFNDFQDSSLREYEFTRFYADEIDRITRGNSGFRSNGFDIIQGDIDGEALEEDLRREGLRSRSDYEGYELFESARGDEHPFPWAAGVNDGTLLTAGSRNEDVDVLRLIENLIDTQEGELRGYQEVSSDFELLMDGSSIGDYFFAFNMEPPESSDPESGDFRDMVGASQNINIGEDESNVELVIAFQFDYEPRESDIETWTREDDLFRLWRDIDIDID